MSNNKFTFEDISASWLGTGKRIPIGQMMAWLIKEVERLSSQIPFSEPISGEIAEVTRIDELSLTDPEVLAMARVDEQKRLGQIVYEGWERERAQLEQENTKLRRFLDRRQGYLLDALNALESMPVSDDQWEKYQRWAEGLRKQTVERIKRELSI